MNSELIDQIIFIGACMLLFTVVIYGLQWLETRAIFLNKKERRKKRDYETLVNVIQSCRSTQQLVACTHLIKGFKRLYGDTTEASALYRLKSNRISSKKLFEDGLHNWDDLKPYVKELADKKIK